MVWRSRWAGSPTGGTEVRAGDGSTSKVTLVRICFGTKEHNDMTFSLFNVLALLALTLLATCTAYTVWLQPEKARNWFLHSYRKDPLGIAETIVESGLGRWIARIISLAMLTVVLLSWVVMLHGG